MGALECSKRLGVRSCYIKKNEITWVPKDKTIKKGLGRCIGILGKPQ